jgi:hypothetical protein
MAGDAFIDYFAHDQNWGDGGMQGAIERKFRMQKQGEFITEFVKEAAKRVLGTEPLRHEGTKEKLQDAS